MKIIVGLGNPGRNFDNTRHNLGFEFIDYLVNEFNANSFKQMNGHLVANWSFNGKKVVFLKPQNFMNNSGGAVSFIVNYFNALPSDVLIIYDDISLPVGTFRFRQKGSSGGHNGIKSIISFLKSDEFSRIKIGIGYNKQVPLNDWVLGKFGEQEKATIFLLRSEIKTSILDWLNK